MNATRVRITEFGARKSRGEKIAMLTAYDATMARLLESAGVDMLLVGDSVGMVVLGHETTVPVTLDVMVHHTAAVVRGTERALVIADMPFLTYHTSIEDAVRHAGRLLQEGGAAGVKLEGGYAIGAVVRRLVQAGIPVMGHIGVLPQSVNQMGGYRKRGTQPDEVAALLVDADALQQAGTFAVVLESIPSDVAAQITSRLEIPTIGIGAGPECSGQILVSYDMLGLFDQFVPPFVKSYANLAETIRTATRAYVDDVRSLRFPLAARPSVGARAGDE